MDNATLELLKRAKNLLESPFTLAERNVVIKALGEAIDEAMDDVVLDRHREGRTVNGLRVFEERALRELFKRAERIGASLEGIHDGDEYTPCDGTFEHRRDVALKLLGDLDDATVCFATPDRDDGEDQHGVRTIMCNGSICDMFADWHCGNEKFSEMMDAFIEWADKLDNAEGRG